MDLKAAELAAEKTISKDHRGDSGGRYRNRAFKQKGPVPLPAPAVDRAIRALYNAGALPGNKDMPLADCLGLHIASRRSILKKFDNQKK